MNKMDETIIVVERAKLFSDENLAFQGTIINEGPKASTGAVILRNLYAHYGVMRRGDAENNADYKQPIPYAIIRKGDHIFMYERLTGGGEERLHNKLSIGVGGHMNDIDDEEKELIPSFGFYTLLSDNVSREIREELCINSSEWETEVFGLINDDSDDVGKVHFGIIMIVDLDEDAEVTVNETDQLAGQWVTMEHLLKSDVFQRLENWSQITLNALAGDQA